jgi:branched-chain amino acid transport system permease protein
MVKQAVIRGLIFGAGAVHLAAVGVLLMMHQRWVVVDHLTLAQATLVLLGMAAGAFATSGRPSLLDGALAGLAAAVPLAALAIFTAFLRPQWMFVALTPQTLKMLTFGLPLGRGLGVLLFSGLVTGFAGAVFRGAPGSVRGPIIAGVVAVMIAGVFQELIQAMLPYTGALGEVHQFVYVWEGLTPAGAVVLFVVGAVIEPVRVAARWGREVATSRTRWLRRYAPRNDTGGATRQRMLRAGIALIALAIMPALAGNYIGQVLMLVGLYILMGMGLNLEVGLAGLLDLGFVAFFAVGAYTTALLTADSPHALLHLSFWLAMPASVALAVAVGVIFGLPVLGVRGDYLAVATMGLGEIVRIIVLSDFAAPLLGGAQGVLQIPKPSLGVTVLSSPVQLFYLTLVASAVAAFVAWRLENSRLGRAWMALRDDEDVAQALGINLVRSKLMAYGLGAAFAGLAGSIFAVMLTSVYPSSFQLLISINVLALIIVGGMGSLPGVVLGSIALIGLPELLREFGEYRYLFYGAVLIVMMQWRPEGLWPSEVRRRELHEAEEIEAGEEAAELIPVQPR